MYLLQPKTKFRRDVKTAQKRGWSLDQLNDAFKHLIQDGALPTEYKPHPLRGDFVGCIDGHIQADWVLIFEVIEDEKIVVLHRTGRHQDVFSGY